jgi:hypothetical protein
MQLVEILVLVQVVLYTVGFGGLVYWVRKHINALEGAVKAQRETILAQGEIFSELQGLLNAMRTVLESTDEPKMLERLKAYKEFSEHENEAALKQQASQFDEEKKKMTTIQAEVLTTAVDLHGKTMGALLQIASEMMPYTPPEERVQLIESINLPDPLGTHIKEFLRRLADQAPDLSRRPSLADYAAAGFRLLHTPPPLLQQIRTEREDPKR